MGNPGRLTTDIGPVIDAEAKANIENHIQAMLKAVRCSVPQENSEDAQRVQILAPLCRLRLSSWQASTS